MAYSTLPTVPLAILGVAEPLLLIWAFISCLNDPFAFYATQAPVPQLNAAEHFPPQAVIFSYMLGNIYLLLAALAVVCCFSSSIATTRWYLIAVAIADYGHIYAVYLGVGPAVFWDVSLWNEMIGGNIGASVILNIVRWLTVMGAFGRLGSDVQGIESRKKLQ
ncbi:unnamed protein product [Discula destructiva]